jgi:hypothetical protein
MIAVERLYKLIVLASSCLRIVHFIYCAVDCIVMMFVLVSLSAHCIFHIIIMGDKYNAEQIGPFVWKVVEADPYGQFPFLYVIIGIDKCVLIDTG